MRIAEHFLRWIYPLVLTAWLSGGMQPALAQSTPAATPPAQQSASPASSTKPEAPKKPDTADDNPFPEELSRKAAGTDAAPASTGDNAGDKPPSNAPPTSDSSSRSKFEGLGDLSDGSDRISNGAGGYIVNPKLAAEDVHVGGLYLEERDYKGAYLRYKEATRVDPENVDAVFGLAEAARGLKKNDEAVQNYLVYLDAAPDSKKAKEARKALAVLGAQPKK